MMAHKAMHSIYRSYPPSVFIEDLIGVMFPASLIILLSLIRKNEIIEQATTKTILKNSPENNLIALKADYGKEKILLLLSEILYIKASDNYSEVYYYRNGIIHKSILRSTLRSLFEQLRSEYFVRTHRSYVINLYNVNRIKGNINNCRIYQNGHKEAIPVARSKKEQILKSLDDLKIPYFFNQAK